MTPTPAIETSCYYGKRTTYLSVPGTISRVVDKIVNVVGLLAKVDAKNDVTNSQENLQGDSAGLSLIGTEEWTKARA